MLLLFTIASFLAPSDSVKSDSVKKARLITPVVVSAIREEEKRRKVSSNIEVLNGDDVRQTRASHPSGLMNRMAGVHVTELSGEGHSTSIRQPMTTNPMYLYLEDGIPTRSTGFFNHNALYEVNIPQAGGIEVIKGPGTALYGSDAIGGVINVLTRPAPKVPSMDLSLEGGAYGYRRVLATGGTTIGRNAFRADLNITGNNGWRSGAKYTRNSGTLRWDALGFWGMSAKTVITGSSINQHDIPTLPSALFGERSTVNTAPIAFREVRAFRYSTEISRENGVSLLSITPYYRHNILNILPYWQLSFDKQVWYTSNNSYGIAAKYRYDVVPGRLRVITGMDMDHSPGRNLVKGVNSSKVGPDSIYQTYTTGAIQYNYHVSYKGISPYMHSELMLGRLGLDAGLRYDAITYTYDTSLLPVSTGFHKVPADRRIKYRHPSPKFGATLDVNPGLALFVSYKHGFRAPSQGQLFQQGSSFNTVGLKPVRANSYEAGARGEFGERLIYQISAYEMRIDDDILTFIDSSGARLAMNAGRTSHRGIELSAGLLITQNLKMDVGYTFTKHTYVHWIPKAGVNVVGSLGPMGTIDYSGKLMEKAPRDFGNVMLTYSPALLNGGRFAMEWSRTGRYAMDPANTRYYPGHNLVNLHFNMIMPGNSEIFMRLINAGNKNYSEITSYDPSLAIADRAQYSPGNPRSLYMGVKYSISRGVQ